MNKKQLIVTILSAVGLASCYPAYGQEVLTDEGIESLRGDIRPMKRQLIAANLNLTVDQARQFWPIYDDYTAEMSRVLDRKLDLIKEYLSNYGAMTNQQADSYIEGLAAVEEAIAKLRLKYMPMFRKALSSKTAARFLQLDWRFSLALDLQVTSEVPIIKP